MATTNRPTGSSSTGSSRNNEDTSFSRALRFEWASEEGRALVGSYGISVGLATAFLLLVFFKELPARVVEEEVPVSVLLLPDTATLEAPPEPAPQEGETERVAAAGPRNQPPGPRGPQAGNPRPGRPGSRTETTSSGAIDDAFGTGSGSGTGGMVGDVSNILRGVDVSSGSGGSGGGLGGPGGGGSGGKTVLGYGQGGQGATRPGRGGIGGGLGTGGGGGGGIGGVGRGGGVTAAAVRVSAPRVVAAPRGSGPGRDVSDLGTFVRQRQAQLRDCYVRNGLSANPNLAGTVTVAITIAGSGAVTGADATSSTWSGQQGASAAESCILSRIRGWRFPASSVGEGTYSFPFNFTK